ncbi:hypothetical protein GIB67_000844 [Kingdonia uniflora]|uniref:Uncharacterized protein n=1 Tax=Kingdonia uniflora TaxID=39325 RepID=A0A7J7NQU5_9MAGN|nr:hypothetical protein GIB67_000844 [Kingdonia uniflora]
MGRSRGLTILLNGEKIFGSFDMPDVSHEYLRDMIVAFWRNFKSDLYAKYVKGKNPMVVKAGVALEFVNIDDWRTFALSEHNSANRKKLVAPACVGINNMAIIRHNIGYTGNKARPEGCIAKRYKQEETLIYSGGYNGRAFTYKQDADFLKCRQTAAKKKPGHYKVAQEEEFVLWLKNQNEFNESNKINLCDIVSGPMALAIRYNKYCTNGFLFVTKDYEVLGRAMQGLSIDFSTFSQFYFLGSSYFYCNPSRYTMDSIKVDLYENVEIPIVSYCRLGSLMEVDTTVQTSEVCCRAVILYDKTNILTNLHCPRGYCFELSVTQLP